jgi:hypothetical protein
MSNHEPTPTPPRPKPLYGVPTRALHRMVLALPRPRADAPDSAWQDAVQDALDKLDALDPRDALEAMLAIDVIALNAGLLDACQLAFEPTATPEQARLQRASAVALHRSVVGSLRVLDRQRRLPTAPERDWGDVPAALGTEWQATPSRPAEPTRGGKTAPDDTPETIVKWYDEIDDVELAIATEQERREQAGEPPLPRKPGQPIVLYRFKPQDYIHKFKPDPKLDFIEK